MDVKIFISIFISMVLAYITYLTEFYLVTGLNPFLLTIFITTLALLIALNAFVIVIQKKIRKRLIMLCFMVMCALSAATMSRIKIKNKETSGTPRKYYRAD